ncbi:MAG: hypothetical protein HON68_06735 [Gammaproteobacteria bacterium]|jgi:hypothetical protein|nr:hypothetical protein [Gammaproteobacteria bacterium]MBT3488241.1 hypothetical protein [Gammaproteobacteria bacterium]MBT3718992.1 hypothetical protein [Gammaproteobacteria bacterium]MBT3843846.1 hypothetical protein [Gammaproteobacteria bacterium]MBT3892408.1 hypothetical protein [Gammaproteobacteria bacterium]
MEVSGSLKPEQSSSYSREDKRLALWAASVYLINLLLLPGIGYLILGWLFWRTRTRSDRPLANNHLSEAFKASTLGGGMIFATLLIFWIGGIDNSNSWVYAIIYFTLVHSTFILLGVLGLSRAFAGEPFHYPLIGKKHASLPES